MKSIGIFLITCMISSAFAKEGTTKKSAAEFLAAGKAEINSGDLNAANENFVKALAVNPKSAPAALGLGQVASLQGRTADAVANFKLCLKLDAKAKECRASLAKINGAK